MNEEEIKNENEKLLNDNNKLKGEIEKIDNELQKYCDIDQQILSAQKALSENVNKK